MPDLPPTSRMLPDGTLRLETPRVFLPLLKPARFKGARGGRGGSKSHFVAERMIADCFQRRQRIACLREYQSSIKESVKQLLEDKIRQFSVERDFGITEAEIRGPNESLIVFKGLHDYVSKPGGGPAAGIKSLEGFTRAWVEEAQTISKRSLEILTPTFRGRPGDEAPPELWFTWNPSAKTDPIEAFFNDNAGDEDFVCVESTFRDNPWFEASGLRRDMERDRARDPDKYAHVWLGNYLTRSEMQVFRNWKIEEFDTPENAPFRFGADWGFAADPTVLIRCWIDGLRLYVDQEAYAVGCKIEATPALFATIPQSRKHRIRADSARPETIDYMKDRHFKMIPAVKGKDSVEDGIEFLKSYDIIIHPRCEHTIDEFYTYSWKVDPHTDKILPQLVDRDNHCIADGELVTCERGLVPIEDVRVGDRVLTRMGYKRVLASWCAGKDRETVLVQAGNCSVRLTLDHEVWSVARGFICVDALRYTDEVLTTIGSRECQSGSEGCTGVVGTIVAMATRLTTRASTMVRRTICIAISGLTTTGRSLLASTFITGTRTQKTTIRLTSNVCQYRTIDCDTHGATSVGHNRPSTLLAFGRSLRLGTRAPMAAESTLRSAAWLTRTLFPFLSYASTAGMSFCPASWEAPTNSAPTIASRKRVERQVSTTWRRFAQFVEALLCGISTRQPRLVPARVQIVYDGERRAVYDLMVEDQHEFFAGGILVHNCIDALRYAVEDDRRKGRPLILSNEALQHIASQPMRDRFAASVGGPRAMLVTRNRFARAR